jgi:hypothetical protein
MPKVKQVFSSNICIPKKRKFQSFKNIHSASSTSTRHKIDSSIQLKDMFSVFDLLFLLFSWFFLAFFRGNVGTADSFVKINPF